VTRGADEPYRMFTSRAEFRPMLRADNADARLTPLGVTLGCVGSERADAYHRKQDSVDAARAALEGCTATPDALLRHGLKINRDGVRRSAFELLSFPDVRFADLLQVWPELGGVSAEAGAIMEIEAKYAHYLSRQAADVEAYRRDEALVLPLDLDYGAIPGLSNEARQKLSHQKPETLGQAGRIPGITPAALVILLRYVRKSSDGAANAA